MGSDVLGDKTVAVKRGQHFACVHDRTLRAGGHHFRKKKHGAIGIDSDCVLVHGLEAGFADHRPD